MGPAESDSQSTDAPAVHTPSISARLRGYASLLSSPRFPLKRVLFAFVFVTHFASGIDSSGDSRWSIHTALSILREGNADLDEYADLVQRQGFYGTRVHKGHIYNWFPMGASLLAVPAVWVAEKVLGRVGINLHDSLKAGVMAGMEVLIASLIVALTAVFFFLTALELTLGRRGLSLGLALLFAFGTSAWSTASRALWMHGPSTLMLAIALHLLVVARRRPALAAYASLPLAFSFVTRPTNSVSIVVLSVYVLIAHRRYFIRFVLLSLPIAVPFILGNIRLYDALLPPYYDATRLGGPARAFVPVGGRFEVKNGERLFVPELREIFEQRPVRLFEALAGNTVSPSRGLFVFSPFLLFAVWGIGVKLRKNGVAPHLARDKLDGALVGVLLLHWVAISAFPHWWGGWSFGPRFFTDMLPVLFYFLVPAVYALARLRLWIRRVALATFWVFVAISLFAHYRGATTNDVQGGWNHHPIPIDAAPKRLWDFRDIQFLRGLTR